MSAGPVIDAAPLRPHPETVSSISPPRHAWVRLGFAVAGLLSLLIGGIAYATGDGNVRVIAFLYFALAGIGSGPCGLLKRVGFAGRVSLTFLGSMAVLVFGSMVMSTYSSWHPIPAFIGVAAVATGFHVFTLISASREVLAERRRQALDAAERTRRHTGDLLRAVGLAWPCIVGGTALWLTAALTHRHIDPGFGGFLTDIGPLWYAGLALVLIGFFLARKRPESVAATAVVMLMLALTLTPSIVYDGARSTTGAKHVGLIQQIRLGTPLDTNVLIYNYWNGFFAAMAWLADLLGIRDPSHFSAFWPSIIGLFRLAALRYLASRFLTRSYHAWTAVALAVLADPIGADYYSPQSVGFVIGMTTLAVALSAQTIRLRWPVILLAGCLLAVSHQLSPYVTAITLIVLVVFRLLKPWWTPLLVLLPANLWALIHRDALKGFISLKDIGQAQNFSPPKTVAVEGLVRLPIVPDASLCLVAGIGVLAILAGISFLRFHDRQSFAMGFCAASGFVFVAVSPYGNEGIFRAFLFSIPWLVLMTMRWIASLRWERVALYSLRPIMFGLAGTFLIASFGLDAINVTKPGDLRAYQTFEAIKVGPTDPSAYLLQLGPGNLPGILASRSARQFEITRTVINDDVANEANDSNPTATVKRLTTEYLDYTGQTTESSSMYVVWSPLSSEFARAYAVERPETFAALRDAFVASPYWTVVVDDHGTLLLRFDGSRFADAPAAVTARAPAA